MTVKQSHSGVRLRPIALPVEHGGWGLLAAPILLGLWVAPSVAGVWLSFAALGAFLTRQPLKLVLADQQRGKRYPRTIWAERFVLLYGIVTVVSFGMAWLTTNHPFWLPLLLAAPLAAIQFRYDIRQQSRSLIAELCGTIAIASTVAALAMIGGWEWIPAFVLWFLLGLKSAGAILYVTIRLRLARGVTVSKTPALIFHCVALVLVLVLIWASLVPWLVSIAFIVLLIRMVIGLLPRSLGTRTAIVGMQELGFSLFTVAMIAIGYMAS